MNMRKIRASFLRGCEELGVVEFVYDFAGVKMRIEEPAWCHDCMVWGVIGDEDGRRYGRIEIDGEGNIWKWPGLHLKMLGELQLRACESNLFGTEKGWERLEADLAK